MVPVFFFLKSVVWGFTAPFGFPKVAPPATCKWLPPYGIESPARLPTPGLDVVLSPKVVPVGAVFGSWPDLYLLSLGGMYFSYGIKL